MKSALMLLKINAWAEYVLRGIAVLHSKCVESALEPLFCIWSQLMNLRILAENKAGPASLKEGVTAL